jgi:hypothetical protein
VPPLAATEALLVAITALRVATALRVVSASANIKFGGKPQRTGSLTSQMSQHSHVLSTMSTCSVSKPAWWSYAGEVVSVSNEAAVGVSGTKA